ncbi:MAG: hypothetical protein ABID54_04635 [Pseudomonadota bacterium]
MAFLSKGRLSNMMLETLLTIPVGSKNLKDNIVLRLGLIGQMSSTRDINAAWDETKKKAAKQYPDKFILDDRNALQWNDGSVKILDKKISRDNYSKLNELAHRENCSVDKLVSKLITSYQRTKRE